MDSTCAEPAVRRPRRGTPAAHAWRWAALAGLVLASWLAVGGALGSGDEAFWLLFPAWVLAGVALRVVRPPPLQVRGRAKRIAMGAFLVLLPAGIYLWIALSLGARISVSELLSVYFFAGPLELILLYLFGAAAWLQGRLAGGAGSSRGRRIAALAASKVLLYGLMVPFLFATFSVHRVKVPPATTPAGLGLDPEEVSFRSRGERPARIRGWFFPRKKAVGTVLACHGVGANRADLLDIVWTFKDEGFQVLVFDFRGHGESEGHTVTYGSAEREDVLGAWDYLMTRPDIDRSRIVGFGVSMGAASLLQALPDLPEMRAALVDSSFTDLHSMALYQFRFVPRPVAVGLAALTELFGWLETGIPIAKCSPIESIERVRMPLFFIHGGDDPVIPPSASEELFAAYGGPKRFRLEPGAGHGGTAAADPQRYGREAREFYLEALR